MRAGILKEVISIYKPVIVTDKFGEETTTYQLRSTTRAQVVNLSGNRNTNNEINYQYIKTLRIRYYVTIDEYDRILWRNKYYRILDINPNKDQMYKEIKIETADD